MKIFCVLFFLSGVAVAAKPEIRATNLEGQAYLCRPAGQEPRLCPSSSDLSFATALAMNAVYQIECLETARERRGAVSKAEIALCVVGPPLQEYANELSLMLVRRECKEAFVRACGKVESCAKSGDVGTRMGRCGNLGEVLDFLLRADMEKVFRYEDGIAACREAF
jgi:hypothetical protein